MKTTWLFTPWKIALLVVSGVGVGYWAGRSVGGPDWLLLEILISASLGAVVLLSCRKKALS
jgi:hypothetical protein